ncbi:hypothetical protein [uncultured Corynebacterium sp.]|uniref:SLAC1 family transporter n=1 Tax=uncultured Corynebacterium sp. TaxID=159447 RepID=UPI0025CC8A8D|nr:hypothetical protein [uncultured Corynebacterium sp.]
MSVTHTPTAPALPAPGAAWGGAVMGLSVTASLLGLHLGSGAGTAVATAVTALAAVVLVVLLLGAVRTPRFDDIPAWSMMAMGVLALGSAADTNLGWTGVHVATWVLGTVAAVTVLAVQSIRLLRGEVPAVFPGVLPLVTPMVAATNAAQLDHPALGTVLFVASLVTALPAFVRVYLGEGRRPQREVAATAWIPLGVVGQSSTAALLLTDGTTVGVVYAVTLLALGGPAAAWAIVNHWGALTHLPAANPSWWAATFPVGTCSLGTYTLADATGAGRVDAVSVLLLVLLCVHVVAAVAGVASAAVAQLCGR